MTFDLIELNFFHLQMSNLVLVNRRLEEQNHLGAKIKPIIDYKLFYTFRSRFVNGGEWYLSQLDHKDAVLHIH